MASNLHVYDLLIIDDLTFQFTTQNGDEYKCYFLSYGEYFTSYPEIASKIFAFNLDMLYKNESAKQKGVDKRLAFTIVSIIKNFLASKINAVVYICDNTDARQAVRFNKFTGWFADYDDGNYIQITGYIKVYGSEYYNALLLHKDNKKKNSFIRAFQELNDQTPK